MTAAKKAVRRKPLWKVISGNGPACCGWVLASPVFARKADAEGHAEKHRAAYPGATAYIREATSTLGVRVPAKRRTAVRTGRRR